jgi:hypothetical protein
VRRFAATWGAVAYGLVFTSGAEDLKTAIYITAYFAAFLAFVYLAWTARQPRSRGQLVPFVAIACVAWVGSLPMGLISPVTLGVVVVSFGVPVILLLVDMATNQQADSPSAS